MYSYITALALAGGVSARVLPRGQDGCCFQLKASGEQSGLVGQLGDGQNRIGGGYQPATFCISNGEITDSNGRGCVVTPPNQFQCDEGSSPTGGFSLSGEGGVQYNGNSKFYACGADKGEYNIYTKPVDGQKDCVEVTLSSSDGKCAGNGGGEGQKGSSSAPAAAASTKPAGSESSAPAEYGSQKPSSSAAPSKESSAPAKPSTKPEGEQPSAPAEKPSSAGYSKYTGVKPSTAPGGSPPGVQSDKPSAAAETQPAVETNQPKPETSQPAVQTSQPKPETYGESVKTSQPAVETNQPKPETSQPAAQTSQPKPETSAESVKTSQPKPETSQPAAQTSQPKPETSAESVKTSQPAAETSIKTVKTSAPAQSEKPKTSQAPQGTAPAGYASSASSQAASSNKPSGTAPAAYASSASSQVASSTKPSGTASGSACQTSLTGAYQTPHLIVPVSSEKPDEAYGTSYNGQINSTTNTIFNFDIPQDYEGKQCSIIFLFPKKEDLETSNYEFGGSGSLGCSELSDVASEDTSYSNAPSADKDLGTIELQPGNSYVVATQECKAGKTQSIELSSEDGLSLNFFEDWNPSPLGLYITSC